jgi:hypothetical protein
MKTLKRYVFVFVCLAPLVFVGCPDEITSHEHAWGEWRVITEPTCENAGYGTRACPCGELDHTIPALGHDWGNWEVTSEPTCTETGEMIGTCVRDETHKETRSVEISAWGHDWEWTVTSQITSITNVQATGTCAHDHTHTKTFSGHLGEYIRELPSNTAATPHTLVLNLRDLGGSIETEGSLGKLLYNYGYSNIYVSLDLSGSTFTSIPDKAFGTSGTGYGTT